MRLFIVGMVCALIDFVAFMVLVRIGYDPVKAHVFSFIFSSLLCGICIFSGVDIGSESGSVRGPRTRQLVIFLFIRLLALALRGGVLATGITTFDIPVSLAAALAVFASAAVFLMGDMLLLLPANLAERQKISAAIGIFIYLLLLRFVFLGLANLLPEEAYYWNYSQHLDIGYLDHPPMVAWLIWLGTLIFGNNEFGVRINAYICWLLTAGFSYFFARNLYGKPTAIVCALLIAVLPFYFSTGFLMMPDAPLTAAWAATLFFLERALLGEKRSAWLGVGLSLGLGLLSKYTILLLAPAALLFVLADPQSRRWLGRKEPYFAAAVAVFLFSPVVYWNATHQWISFAFQGARRVGEPFHFSLPSLIASAAILLTPTGFLAALASLKIHGSAVRSRIGTAKALFVILFTLTPLAVFVVFSLFHENKPNWTGPLWLAILPSIASVFAGATGEEQWLGARLKRVWIPTLGITAAVYAALLHYAVLGFPGVGYIHNIRTLPVAWTEFGQAVRAIEATVAEDDPAPIVLIGTDKYFLASEIAFYVRQGESIQHNSIGSGAIGGSSLMYDTWYPTNSVRGSSAVIVSLKRGELQQEGLSGYFSRLSDIKEQIVQKRGVVVGSFFYRIGYDLRDCTAVAVTCGLPSGS